METFSSRVKDLRKRKKMDQRDLADALGVTQSYISLLETKGVNLTKDKLTLLASILDTTTNYLLDGNTAPLIENENDALKPDYVDFAVWLSSQGELSERDLEKIKKLIKVYLDE